MLLTFFLTFWGKLHFWDKFSVYHAFFNEISQFFRFLLSQLSGEHDIGSGAGQRARAAQISRVTNAEQNGLAQPFDVVGHWFHLHVQVFVVLGSARRRIVVRLHAHFVERRVVVGKTWRKKGRFRKNDLKRQIFWGFFENSPTGKWIKTGHTTYWENLGGNRESGRTISEKCMVLNNKCLFWRLDQSCGWGESDACQSLL